MSKNLLNLSNWDKISETRYYKILDFNNNIYGTNSSGLFELKEDGTTKRISPENIQYSSCNEENLIFGRSNIFFIYDKTGNIKSYNKESNFNDIKYNRQKNIYWSACGNQYMNAFQIKDNNITQIYSSIIPDSPRRELFYYMNFFDGKLMIAGGKLDSPEVFNIGTVMTYNNGTWSYLDENLSSYTGISYYNTTSIAIDPRDKNHIFVSSSFGGLYEFKDGKFINLYTYYDDEPKRAAHYSITKESQTRQK